jgi:uncharacterized protein (TIGR03435 family)
LKRNLSRIVTPILLALSALTAHTQVLHADGPRPSFEVATIKPSPSDTTGTNMMLAPARFKISHITIRELMKFAYNIRSDDQLTNGPAWIKTSYFDVTAKADQATVDELAKLPVERRVVALRLMTQSLLAERLKLQLHSITESLPVYELVVAKGGSKLTEISPPPVTTSSPTPAAPAPKPLMIGYTGKNQLTANDIGIGMLAEWLGRQAEIGNRPVIDKTGLNGKYDFVLNGVAEPRASSSPGPGAEEGSLSLFTILPEQLGLRLVPTKQPTEVLVIDTIEQPTEN